MLERLGTDEKFDIGGCAEGAAVRTGPERADERMANARLWSSLEASRTARSNAGGARSRARLRSGCGPGFMKRLR